MVITGREEAWREAEACLSKAKTTKDGDAKRLWLDLAGRWCDLAEVSYVQRQSRYIPPEDL